MLFRSDRKSTRLNSSHTIISYAVFCLKKKKQKVFQLCYHHRHCCSLLVHSTSGTARVLSRLHSRRVAVRHMPKGCCLYVFFFKIGGAPGDHPFSPTGPLPV